MARQTVILEKPERFSTKHEIPREKLDRAIRQATDKLESMIPFYNGLFAKNQCNYIYVPGPNDHWVAGMFTGMFWLAYELTGKKVFYDVAMGHMATYKERIDQKIKLDDHDVGFVFTPSCIAGYKLTGDESIKQIVLDAADYFYNTSYSKEGGFIIRSWKSESPAGYRTMMDTLMNIPMLFWAGEQTGKQEYIDAAISQYRTTEKCLIRDDGSSFHHYQFDPETHKPLYGLTFQGHADDSCWSRGHAWGVYGFPLSYKYTQDPALIPLHKDVTYFMLNHLPEDFVPYWDYDFVEGDEPRDTSAAVISVCGMNEMCRHLPDDAPQKAIFENAAAQILESVIDNYTGEIGVEYHGLIHHVTGAKPQGRPVNTCSVYGDYHYLEALLRFVKPDWKCYW